MENKMKLEFINESCNERFARMTATAFAAILDPTVEEIAEIKTAVSEAVTNAIIHGYENCSGIVTMEGEIHNNEIIFTIHDDGCGIENIEKAREPLYTGKPELERSGMGFSIMECFMDRVTVESRPGEGTTVIMSKVIEK
jgi:stage II sporulation protein AB (anti-sigma F factor)